MEKGVNNNLSGWQRNNVSFKAMLRCSEEEVKIKRDSLLRFMDERMSKFKDSLLELMDKRLSKFKVEG